MTVYDNRTTMCRELWDGKRLIWAVSMELGCLHKEHLPRQVGRLYLRRICEKPWGSYPDKECHEGT